MLWQTNSIRFSSQRWTPGRPQLQLLLQMRYEVLPVEEKRRLLVRRLAELRQLRNAAADGRLRRDLEVRSQHLRSRLKGLLT